MFRIRGLLFISGLVAGLLLSLAHTASAATLTLSLSAPQTVGSVVSFELTGAYAPAPGEPHQFVDFQIDVFGSDLALSRGGTDYSAFTFALAPDLVPGWELAFPFASPKLDFSFVQALTETFPPHQPLPAGTHLLGTLSVDLGALGLSPVNSYIVRIDGPDTAAGIEVIGDPPTFTDATVLFATASQPTNGIPIPLPNAALLSAPLLAICLTRRRARRTHA